MVRRTLRECARDPPGRAHPGTSSGHLPGWAGQGGLTEPPNIPTHKGQSPSPDPSKGTTGCHRSPLQASCPYTIFRTFPRDAQFLWEGGKPAHNMVSALQESCCCCCFPRAWGPQRRPCPPVPGQRANSSPRKHPVPDNSPVLRSKPSQCHLPLKYPSWTKELLARGVLAGYQPPAAPSHPTECPQLL